jgi:NAD(P)-dependent dehydrogenase (short-subunit alcohol dehydrogenase family)
VHVPCFDPAELDRFEHAGDAAVSVVTGVDLRDEGAVERYFADLPGLFSLVNVAGGFAMSPIARTSAADFEHMMAMNARTCFLCCREGVKKMRGHARQNGGRGGRIVNVAARPALEPRMGAGMAAYTASKAAVAALTAALAEEVAGEGILVNAVAPSIMDTPANRAAMPGADYSKWPKVEDVARTIEFLASPANTVTRGGIVPVYGRS